MSPLMAQSVVKKRNVRHTPQRTLKMRESVVEKYLHQQVVKAGGTTRKWKSPGRANVPDRIVFWPRGVVHFIETKATGKPLRAAQKREHKRLLKFGARVDVIDSKAAVDDYVRRWSWAT